MENVAYFGTGLGLATAAGLNAYAVLLVYGGLAHLFPGEFPGVITGFLAEPGTLAVLLALYLVEFVADKIPGLDHLWDGLHTVLRPLAGASLAVAALPPSAGTAMDLLGCAGGAVMALASHIVKATVRLTSTALTAGVANFALSVAEDVLAALLAVVSVFLPHVALVLVAAVAVSFLLSVPKLAHGVDLFRSRRRRRASKGP